MSIIVEKHFDDLQEAEEVSVYPGKEDGLESHLAPCGSNTSWFGVRSGVAGVKKIVSEGWKDGAERIEELGQQIEVVKAKSIKRRTIRGASGQTLNMSAVYSGNLSKCWTSRRRSGAIGPKKISILFQVGANSDVDAERLFWRGAALAKVSEVLSEAGYSVQILGFSHTVGQFTPSGDTLYTFNIKGADESIDVHRLATITALAGYFRYYVFKIFHTAEQKLSYALGRAASAPAKLFDQLKPNHIISGFESINNLAAAQKFINDKINELEQGA